MTTSYTADAQRALDGLWASDPATAERIEDALDLLEDDPTDPRCRAVSLRPRPGEQVWGMPIRTPTEDWITLWHYRDNENNVVVLYIGTNFIH